jgi:N-acetylneuraminate synthase
VKLSMKLASVIKESYSISPSYIYIIAEIGINHNGSVDIAKKLIEMAKLAGCDAVKFQKRDLELVYGSKFLEEPRESPWGKTQGDQKRSLEFDREQYSHLKDFTKSCGLDFSASAWDVKSLNFLDEFDLDFHKVASAMITNLDFLAAVASRKKLTLLSLGMSDWQMADRAIQIFDDMKCPVIPMHCVSTYPAKNEELNLIQISEMQERYKRVVGYSGHESSVSPSIVAATLGARVIERHITLDRSMYGSDQSASLEQPGLARLVGSLRKLPKLYGVKEKQILSGEMAIAKKLRYWEN